MLQTSQQPSAERAECFDWWAAKTTQNLLKLLVLLPHRERGRWNVQENSCVQQQFIFKTTLFCYAKHSIFFLIFHQCPLIIHITHNLPNPCVCVCVRVLEQSVRQRSKPLHHCATPVKSNWAHSQKKRVKETDGFSSSLCVLQKVRPELQVGKKKQSILFWY